MTSVKKILLIDDSAATNNFHNRILTRLNFAEEIIITTNGREGLDYLNQTTYLPEIIFLDLNMPILDGFEFLSMLDETFEVKNVEKPMVVILSSSEESIDQERCSTLYTPLIFGTKPLTIVQLSKIQERMS